MVATPESGSGAARHGGSSPFIRTICRNSSVSPILSKIEAELKSVSVKQIYIPFGIIKILCNQIIEDFLALVQDVFIDNSLFQSIFNITEDTFRYN